LHENPILAVEVALGTPVERERQQVARAYCTRKDIGADEFNGIAEGGAIPLGGRCGFWWNGMGWAHNFHVGEIPYRGDRGTLWVEHVKRAPVVGAVETQFDAVGPRRGTRGDLQPNARQRRFNRDIHFTPDTASIIHRFDDGTQRGFSGFDAQQHGKDPHA